MVYALTLICRLQTNTLCKCLSQTQNSSRSWSPFCIQTQGDWFWFYTHILARAGAHLRWFLRPDPCPLFNVKSPVPCTLPTPWLSVLEVSWPPAHPASPLVLQRVDEADERLQRTSRAGLTVMWLITKAALEHIIWSRSWEKPVDGLGILDPGWEDYSWFYLHCFATLTRVARRLWCSGNSLEFLSWWFKDLVLKQFLLVKYFKLWHNFLEITIIFKPNKRQSFMACVNSNNPLENVWHFMNIYCLAFLPALK